jgi:hypothetical protein
MKLEFLGEMAGMGSSPRILGHLIVETVRSVLGGERLHRLPRMYGNMPATLNGTFAIALEPLSNENSIGRYVFPLLFDNLGCAGTCLYGFLAQSRMIKLEVKRFSV